MPKPIASARTVMRLVDKLADIALSQNLSATFSDARAIPDTVHTLRAEIASRLRRMERGEK